MTTNHYLHVCLTCDGTIGKTQEEILVPGSVIRYRHANETDCRAALGSGVNHSHVGNKPREDGRVVKLPTLDMIERNI